MRFLTGDAGCGTCIAVEASLRVACKSGRGSSHFFLTKIFQIDVVLYSVLRAALVSE